MWQTILRISTSTFTDNNWQLSLFTHYHFAFVYLAARTNDQGVNDISTTKSFWTGQESNRQHGCTEFRAFIASSISYVISLQNVHFNKNNKFETCGSRATQNLWIRTVVKNITCNTQRHANILTWFTRAFSYQSSLDGSRWENSISSLDLPRVSSWTKKHETQRLRQNKHVRGGKWILGNYPFEKEVHEMFGLVLYHSNH